MIWNTIFLRHLHKYIEEVVSANSKKLHVVLAYNRGGTAGVVQEGQFLRKRKYN